ncbi:MAG: hypothetical protein UT05_C0006G0028 [Parcubacteria group bacterium GW2011_GWF2_38_76]|nr:MAG: hypothetical protein UT05_C0006G0028 [Parcubacteria group bacterium GW2011_GWF2_38_76]HBM45871.1 hypothetical protein [Patescibacteria group bacterium]
MKKKKKWFLINIFRGEEHECCGVVNFANRHGLKPGEIFVLTEGIVGPGYNKHMTVMYFSEKPYVC